MLEKAPGKFSKMGWIELPCNLSRKHMERNLDKVNPKYFCQNLDKNLKFEQDKIYFVF
jgi:hypothetical protein